MKAIVKASFVTILALGFTIMLYSFRPGGENFTLITDLTAVLFSLSAVVTGIHATRMYRIKSLHGRSLFLILLGMTIWLVAEVLWLLFMSPIRMILEALRFLGYVPMTIGFFYALRVSDPSFREEKRTITIVLASFILFSLIYLNTLPVLFGQQSLVENILSNGYIVADFTLLFGIALLVKVSFSFRGGYMSKAWLIFILAFISVLVFDINFAFNYKTYTSGDFSEIFWLSNYILVSYGFYYNSYVLSRLRDSGKRHIK